MQSQPSDQDVAWAAGLFEGEGTLNHYPRGNKQGVQIRLSMSDRDVVERFAKIVGVGAVHSKMPVSTDIRDRSHFKPMYEWWLYEAAEVVRVIDLLLPWLGSRRQARAVEVLKVAAGMQPHVGKRTHCPQGHPYEGDNLRLERHKDGTVARVCRICQNKRSRDRIRAKRGIAPENYRIKE